MEQTNRPSRWLHLISVLLILAGCASQAADTELFGEPKHKVVYQFNQADPQYMEAVLYSVSALMRRWGDDVHIVVTTIGPGIHILAKNPGRPVAEIVRQRVSSLALYGVEFHACGNTMRSLKWEADDLLDFAKVVEIGAEDLVILQEQGYSYISW